MESLAKQWTRRFSRITSGGNFIPEIDGLRFLAISSVLLFHASYALLRAYEWDLGPGGKVVSNLFARGALGVELFFVISGFILAVPFARHFLEGAKNVDLPRYYLRRVTRLEPPYILTLILFYMAAWLTHDAAMRGRLVSTFFVRLFYLHGLYYQAAPVLNGVTWSLEIEVQFYLIVPRAGAHFLSADNASPFYYVCWASCWFLLCRNRELFCGRCSANWAFSWLAFFVPIYTSKCAESGWSRSNSTIGRRWACSGLSWFSRFSCGRQGRGFLVRGAIMSISPCACSVKSFRSSFWLSCSSCSGGCGCGGFFLGNQCI